MFRLGTVSKQRLKGVHPDLVKVVERAIQITEIDFAITEGLRTEARQRQLVKAGASWTMKSRHLTGHAVDVAALISSQIRWDWPLYDKINAAFQAAADELNIPIVWGGSWKVRDGCHFELSQKAYPV